MMKSILCTLFLSLALLSLSGCLLKAPVDAAADIGSGAVHVATDVV